MTGPAELLYRCLAGVAEHTPADTTVIVVDSAPLDPAVMSFLDGLDRPCQTAALPTGTGPVALAQAALDAAADADPVLLASHAIVFDGWLERLCRAGRSDSTIATASALGNSAGGLSVPEPYEPLPVDVSLERLAERIAARSPGMRPRSVTADGHCIWLSRAALELVGPLDDAFASSRAAVIDLAQRCLARGLLNVVADDVFVPSVLPGLSAHGGPLSVGDDRPLLERRYAYLRGALAQEVSRPLASAVAAARRLTRKTSVTVDARILRGAHSGAQTETLQLIETLAGSDEVNVRVLIDPAADDSLSALDRMPAVERMSADRISSAPRSDVVHRPYQVTSAEDLDVLATVGERLVLNHLDLIAYHNASYFGSFEAWHQFRRVTGLALARADRVVFRTEHAARDAIREGLVERERVRVMPLRLDPALEAGNGHRPEGTPEGPFLFCVGNDFRHKNRLFALKLLEALRERGWSGHLVLAGADVGLGSSRGDEAKYLAGHDLSAAVHDLPALGAGELRWLYANAVAVVYPTVYEGFGLIPFEAVRAGTPCLFAEQASLAETMPSAAATLVPWSATLSAERVLPLLEDSTERRRHVELVREAARAMGDSDSITAALLDVYEEAMRAPLRETALLAKEALAREAQLAKWVGLEENMGPLVGPDAYLPPEVQRALLAVATRKRLRGPLFAMLRMLYRAGRSTRSAGDR